MKCPRTYAHIRTKKIGHNWTVYRMNHTLSHSPMVQKWRSIRTRAQRDLKNLNHYTYACVHGKPGEQALSNTAFVCWIPLRQKPDSINVLLGTIEKGGNKVGTFLPTLKEKPPQKSSERAAWGSWRSLNSLPRSTVRHTVTHVIYLIKNRVGYCGSIMCHHVPPNWDPDWDPILSVKQSIEKMFFYR